MYTKWEYKVVSLDEFAPPDDRAFDIRLWGALTNFGSFLCALVMCRDKKDVLTFHCYSVPLP